mmetsp:Transcript_4424/g.5961  ORF Transcript_4424/g.5961 Transcript_4424/m.5961 type:complete len:393 (+) Transcript_4424:260-1438(+)|eukprot:CAMPEP_0196580296 /NCGR_PEP_ID=MMETSP1081-20130531/28338_1 /TAXON_ID=36882 /ORGANISM="Pyramimonas amylifera, Strain CCMP720" /LENGTH=392 /DNA_ID=CAMNT_0041900129 /DNA_START=230 /DNA_END=1408 /DNA_ORIENTATION=-
MKNGFLGPPPEKKPAPALQTLSKSIEGEPVLRAPRVDLSISDFVTGDVLGDGSFSHVIKANRKGTDEWYALKIMDKRYIMKEKKVEYIKNERNILDRIQYDGVVHLAFTFQDANSLYMGLEMCEQGELYSQIKRKGKLSLEEAKFYAAEIVLILEVVHRELVIHRDVKPENLLVSDSGHMKLCDFGSAKMVDSLQALDDGANDLKDGSTEKRRSSFVGTAEYVSPEVLNGGKLTKCADFWSFGCVLFQMLVGKPPFRGETEYLTFQKVINNEMREVPEDLDPAAKDFILKLLHPDPDLRLGAGLGGHASLRAHPFFEGTDWDNIRTQTAPEIAPPPVMDEDEMKAGDEKLNGMSDNLENEWGPVCQVSGGGEDGSNFVDMRSLHSALSQAET